MNVIARQLRGRLLACVYESRPLALRQPALYRIVADEAFAAKPRDVSQEMAYLVAKDLAVADGPDAWRITAAGIDCVEGTTPCDPGIILPGQEA